VETEKAEKSLTHYSIEALIIFSEEKLYFFLYDEILENSEGILKLIENGGDVVSVVKLDLGTGKKHQIRAHMAQYLNSPILFDEWYGFDQNTVRNPKLKNLITNYKEILEQ
jgi:23S rRNA-/tRNA-specific pseudouridylate synthase